MIQVDSTSFVRQSEAARICGVTRQTIYNYAQSGLIPTQTNAFGRSRYHLQSALDAFGVLHQEQETETVERSIVIYGRVSSEDQKRAGNLDRQIERLRKYVSEKWNGSNVVEIQDCCSAFKQRDGFDKLLDAILDGKVSIVVCEVADRLNRQSSSTAILEKICKRHNVEIVCVEQNLSASDQSDLVSEICDYMTCICNSLSSRKQAKRAKKHIADHHLERCHKLLHEGHTIQSVTRLFTSEGITAESEKDGKCPINHTILGERYRSWLAVHTRRQVLTNGEVETVKDSFDRWINDCCTVGENERGWFKELLDSYNSWVQDVGFTQTNKMVLSRQLAKRGFKSYKSTRNRTRYRGISLN